MKQALSSILIAVVVLVAASAQATLVNVDQIIYQNSAGVNPALISGMIDVSQSSSTITILLRNTSANGAFTDPSAPALMLLTGLGFKLPTGIDIVGGSVALTSTSELTSVFGSGVATSLPVNYSGTNLSTQWGYGNGAIAGFGMANVFIVDEVVTSTNGGNPTPFSGSSSLKGPAYGLISGNETQFGASQEAVKDTVKIVLNLNCSGTTCNTIDISDANNYVLAFGSPDTVRTTVPEGGSATLMLAFALLGLKGLRRRLSK